MSIFNRFGNYSLFFVWGLVFVVSLFFPTTPLTLLLGFLFLIFMPGFTLSRLIKIDIDGLPAMQGKALQAGRFNQWMIYLATGFIFHMLMALIAILVHANILILMIAYGIILPIIFIGAYLKDRQNLAPTTLAWKEIFQIENLIYLIPIVLVVIVMLALDIRGVDFAGDPSYHLSIMRKVVDGGPFGVGELAFLKNQPQIQYAYPIWLVFLGFIAKTFHLGIITTWNGIVIGLTAIVALAWAWMFKQLFNAKFLAILSVVIFLIFNLTNSGWILTRLPIPDTICKLFLLPLSLALAFQFIFDLRRNWKILGLTSLMLLMVALIHSTQYVYFFFMLGAFGVLYALIFFRQENYLETLKRIGLIIIAGIVIFLPFLAYLQLKYHVIGSSLAWFAESKLVLIYGHFKDYEPPIKFAFLVLPLTALFWRKNPKLLFLSSVMLLAPIIYYVDFLREFISLKLSFVLVRRMFTNTTWYFGVWALISGSVIILIDRLSSLKPKFRAIINSIVVALVALVIIFDLKFHWLAHAYQAVFGPKLNETLKDNLLWIVIIILILAIALLVGQKFWHKLENFFTLSEPKNPILAVVLILLLGFWLMGDSRPFLFDNFQKQIQAAQFFRAIPDIEIKAAQSEDIGGDSVLKFIKEQIPKRAVFATSSGYRDLSELVDVYMAAWPGVWEPEKELSGLYRTDMKVEQKFACLSYYQIEYLILTGEPAKVAQFGFGAAPQYLTMIYDTTYPLPDQSIETAQIYRIDRQKIQSDYHFNSNDAPPMCRAKKYKE